MGATDLKAVETTDGLGPTRKSRFPTTLTERGFMPRPTSFNRNTGFGSGYVVRANLSHARDGPTGWSGTFKISQRESPISEKIAATFETYWNGDGELVAYSPGERDRLATALRQERQGNGVSDLPSSLSYILTSPAEILDRLEAERSIQEPEPATGCGCHRYSKTIKIAAFDYRNWSRQQGWVRDGSPRLLFIAHARRS